MDYPLAKRENVALDFHGTKVDYPYKWMEDPNSKETKEWTIKQNKLTDSYIEKIGTKKKYYEYLAKLSNYEKRGVPVKVLDKYYFMQNNGLQNQYVLYVTNGLDGDKKVVLDPNLMSDDGTVALKSTKFSQDGKFVAYSISEKGSDKEIIKVRNLETGKDTNDVLNNCRVSSFSWRKDNRSFYYTRYDSRDNDHDELRFNKVYLHKLGDEQNLDTIEFENIQDKDVKYWCHVTDDKEYLVVYSMKGCGETNGVHIRKEGGNNFISVYENEDSSYEVIGNDGDLFYIITNKAANKKKVLTMCLSSMKEKELIPENDSVLETANLVGNNFAIVYQNNAQDKVFLYSLSGKKIKEIDIGGIGTILNVQGKRKDTKIFFAHASFISPTTVYYYDLESENVVKYFSSSLPVDLNGLTIKQKFVSSKDGTQIPIFVVSRGDAHGKPTILTGYGGFNISKMPYFSTYFLTFIQHGGTLVSACLRGGGEYGTKWHQDGMREKKQNVFDDFIACAEFLQKEKYCSKNQLAIMGGSNGGLLVAACMLQRPELFKMVCCHVPVADMLRFHKFTGGKYWVPEYGCADVREDFSFLFAYSPIHNVKSKKYPLVYITSADKDDRVVSSHSKQLAALMQENQQGEDPILLRVETKAGHGQGKPMSMILKENAEELSLIFNTLK